MEGWRKMEGTRHVCVTCSVSWQNRLLNSCTNGDFFVPLRCVAHGAFPLCRLNDGGATFHLYFPLKSVKKQSTDSCAGGSVLAV